MQEKASGAQAPVRLRDHAVDIHSHIVPGVDDGSRTIAESLELALLDRADGRREGEGG